MTAGPRRVHRTQRAQREIDAIAEWIARDSLQAALDWLVGLDEKLRSLAETPGLGTDRGDLGRRLRSSPYGNYVVFVRPTRDGIIVVRVLHGARDYRRLFGR